MSQYGHGPIVYRAARTRSGSGGTLHRDRECDALAQCREDAVLEKPLPSFPEWVPRCRACFPEG